MKNTNLKILLCVVPVVLILLNLIDLYNLLFGNDSYPFESELLPNGSIYTSKKNLRYLHLTIHSALECNGIINIERKVEMGDNDFDFGYSSFFIPSYY